MEQKFVGEPAENRVENWSRWLELAVVLSAAAWIAYRLYLSVSSGWGYTADDAWIPLRYARNLVEGAGVTWNAGEAPVEGYSSFSFVLLGAAALATNVNPFVVYKSACVASAVASLIGLYALTRQWTRPIFAVLPPAVLVSYYGYDYWLTSGLETSFYILCYISATLAMTLGLQALQIGQTTTQTSSAETAWPVCAGLIIFVASLTRPEGPIVGITLGIPLLLAAAYYRLISPGAEQGRRDAAKLLRAFTVLATSAAIPFAIYFNWRYLTFHRVFANTVYCKAWTSSDPRRLFYHFVALAAFPALIALIRNPRNLQFKDMFLVLPTIAYLYLVYGANPLIGHYNRHVLAAYSLLLVAAAIGVNDLSKLFSWRALPVFLGVLLLSVLIISAMPADKLVKRLERQSQDYSKGQENRAKMVDWVNSQLGPEETWAIGDVGLVGFRSVPKVMDVYCLNNAAMTVEGCRQSSIETADLVMTLAPEILAVSTRDPETFDPISIWKKVAQREDFKTRYKRVKVFGFPGNMHNYWMYRRQDLRGSI